VWWHFILRAAVVYFMVLLLLRLSGKRQVGQMTPFDLVLLLLISNAVQNAMNGGDNSVPGGLISAGTVIAMNAIVSRLTFHSRTLSRIIEGRALVLVKDGKVIEKARRFAMMTREELLAALRAGDCQCVEEVHYAMLENTGEITVVKKRNHGEVHA
jgi:uncharacterized membrane protein YcaP (DUF421 family)